MDAVKKAIRDGQEHQKGRFRILEDLLAFFKIRKVSIKIRTLYLYPFLLFLIGGLAFYIRAIPKIEMLQAIDPYYIFRITYTLIENHFVLPSVDVMRYYPTGFSPLNEYYVLYYIYGILYTFFAQPFGIEFLKFAQYIPPLLSFFYVPLLYFVTLEIFGKKYKLEGVLAGFAFAVSNATLFRSSKGFFEKEPLAGIFILLSFLFFVRAQKYHRVSESILAGIFTAYAYAVWGGSVMLIYLYTAYMFFLLLTGKADIKDGLAYVTYGFSYLLMYHILYIKKLFHFTHTQWLLVLSILGTAFLIGVSWYFRWGEKEKKLYFPLIIFSSLIFGFILGFFFSPISRVLISVKRIVIYKKEVIESTVAENISANVWYFLKTFGISTTKTLLDTVLSFWFIALGASYYFFLKKVKNKSLLYLLFSSHTVAILSYYAFLKSSGGNTLGNVIYAVAVALNVGILLFLNLKKESLLYLFTYATLLLFVTKVRIAYSTGLFLSLFVGYGLGAVFRYIAQNWKSPGMRGDIIVVAGIIYLGLTSYYNIAYAFYVAKSFSYTERNELWDEALNFLKYNTTQDAVILSWWDFGYWFQTVGERKTLLDGGNQQGYRNVFAARYFTGRYNETWDMLYLAVFRPTHLLLDYTMIGKYAAMSKIANNGKWIDSYGQLFLNKQQGNYLIYSMPYHRVYVPITPNGTIDLTKGITLLSGQVNTLYIEHAPKIRYLCTPQGVIDLSFFVNASIYIDECLFILPYYPQVAYLTFTHPENKIKNKIFNSNFHKLYIENGQRVPYVKKVFDNFYVKIYEINYTYIENYLRSNNITEEYINNVREYCISSYKTVALKKCPLYYSQIDYS